MRVCSALAALVCALTVLTSATGALAVTEGMVIKEAGIPIITVWQTNVDGEIELIHEETSPEFEVFWLDQDSLEVQPSGPDDSLSIAIADGGLATATQTGQWTFTLESIGAVGMTQLTFRQYSGNTLEYTSEPIELHIEEEHEEANGLIIFEQGIPIVQVWETNVIGEIEVAHLEETDTLEVFFLDVDSLLFQPEPPDFTLRDSIADTTIAAFNTVGDWTFTISGVEEGMTDLFLAIFHDGHDDYLSPAIEVHVEEEHEEANGLIIFEQGIPIVQVWETNVIGEIEVAHLEETDTLEVFFLDVDSLLFQPEPPDFTLRDSIADTTIAAFNTVGDWTFTISGVEEGMTDLFLAIFHDGHDDYLSPAIEVHVEEEHEEANGLIIFEQGIPIVQVWETNVIGEIEVAHLEETDTLEVFFLDVDSLLFQPEPPDFTLRDSIADTTIAAFNTVGDWTFTISGVEEGMTDLFLAIFHDGHDDYLSPAIEVHVEEEHAEANGMLVFRKGEGPSLGARNDASGTPLVEVWESTVLGQLDVIAGHQTPELEAFFLDADSLVFQEEESDFWLVGTPADPGVALYDSTGQWTFSIEGVSSGTTHLVAEIYHIDHPDWTSPDIPVIVSLCDCPYQADINADNVWDAVDLNLLINTIFFNGPNPQDPSCPSHRADLNFDVVEDAIDLNLLISLLFFNGPEPIDPCAIVR